MSVVVDASVALKWVLDEEGSQAADALLDGPLMAPGLWLIEAANALWRRARQGEITAAEAEERLAELVQAPVATLNRDEDLLEAIRLAAQLEHPVYDCLYLAMAVREGGHVVTADSRFHAAVQSSPALASRVRLLGR